jgi:hypothetical protein
VNHADGVAVAKVFRQAECLHNSTFVLLVGVRQMFQVKIPTISQEPQKFSGVLSFLDRTQFLNLIFTSV